MKKSLYLALFLAVIGIVSALVLSLTNSLTAPIISEAQIAKEKANLIKIYPESNMTFEAVNLSGQFDYIQSVYKAKQNDQTIGYIYKVQTNGYNSQKPIVFLVAINTNGEYVAFEPLEQAETPGFGAAMVEASYKESFVNKSIEEKADAISGATRTTQAIRRGLDEVVEHYLSNFK